MTGPIRDTLREHGDGHVGLGISSNRYPYAWDNPLLYFDLDGRFPGLSDVGSVIVDTVDAGWDASAGARDFLGLAGDGNGGWLSEAPGFISDRAQDFVKQIDFSTNEFIGNLGALAGGSAICGIAGISAGLAGTPAAGLAAARLCSALNAIGAAEAVRDILDHDNELWTNEFFG